MIHGLFDTPDTVLSLCKDLGMHDEKIPILLSIPSFFALEWAKLFVILIKRDFPKTKIMVGGRWVIGNSSEWIKNYLKVDLVVPGIVGNEIVDLVSSLHLSKITVVKLTSIDRIYVEEVINYEYLHDRHLIQPSI